MSESNQGPKASKRETKARRVFTEEFKRDAVRLATERGDISQAARDLGVHESVLSRWKRQLDAGTDNPFPGKGNAQDPDLAHLKRENARLKEENEISANDRSFAKKAVGIFTVRPPQPI